MKLKKRKKASVLSRAKHTYRFTPGHSDKAKERERDSYRKERGKDFELVGATVLRALEHIDLDAEVMPVFNQISNEMEQQPVLRLSYVAKLLNVSYQTLWRWTTETQQLPMPVLVDNSKGREYPVYHVDEVRVMIGTIGEHLRAFKYYRSDHEKPKNELFTEIEALRAVNFRKSGEDTHGYQEKRQKPRRKVKARRRDK